MLENAQVSEHTYEYLYFRAWRLEKIKRGMPTSLWNFLLGHGTMTLVEAAQQLATQFGKKLIERGDKSKGISEATISSFESSPLHGITWRHPNGSRQMQGLYFLFFCLIIVWTSPHLSSNFARRVYGSQAMTFWILHEMGWSFVLCYGRTLTLKNVHASVQLKRPDVV